MLAAASSDADDYNRLKANLTFDHTLSCQETNKKCKPDRITYIHTYIHTYFIDFPQGGFSKTILIQIFKKYIFLFKIKNNND